MGRNQGFSRLTHGIDKQLTKSEIGRGYIFITNDKLVKSEHTPMSIKINGEEIGIKELDNSGRIYIGRNLTQLIGKSVCRIHLKACKLAISYK